MRSRTPTIRGTWGAHPGRRAASNESFSSWHVRVRAIGLTGRAGGLSLVPPTPRHQHRVTQSFASLRMRHTSSTLPPDQFDSSPTAPTTAVHTHFPSFLLSMLYAPYGYAAALYVKPYIRIMIDLLA